MWAALVLHWSSSTIGWHAPNHRLLAGLLSDKSVSRGAPASAKEVDRLQRLPGAPRRESRTHGEELEHSIVP